MATEIAPRGPVWMQDTLAGERWWKRQLDRWAREAGTLMPRLYCSRDFRQWFGYIPFNTRIVWLSPDAKTGGATPRHIFPFTLTEDSRRYLADELRYRRYLPQRPRVCGIFARDWYLVSIKETTQ